MTAGRSRPTISRATAPFLAIGAPPRSMCVCANSASGTGTSPTRPALPLARTASAAKLGKPRGLQARPSVPNLSVGPAPYPAPYHLAQQPAATIFAQTENAAGVDLPQFVKAGEVNHGPAPEHRGFALVAVRRAHLWCYGNIAR